jgi:DNA-binding NarL/FixJ family response regulator
MESASGISGYPECVVLADRHHGLTEGVRGLLATIFDVVVMVADERSLLETASRIGPALAVVEQSLGRNGLGWLTHLRARCPRSKVIVLSVHDEPAVMRASMRAGADGFVLKRAIGTDLIPAIETVLSGRRYPDAADRPE